MNARATTWVGRALDVVLAATLVVVPLGFTTSMRSFANAKVVTLELLVGATLVLAGFATRPSFRAAAPALVLLAIAVLVRPDVEGLAGAGMLAAMAALTVLLAERVPSWSRRRLVAVLAVPIAVGLALSLAQSVGVGVLDATADAFGGGHGRIVGTVGNPNENTWYLLLAIVLLSAFVPTRATVVLLGALALIVALDRSRATALVGAIALVVWTMRERGTSARLLAAAGLCIAILVGLAWGGADALHGRMFLARIGFGMLARTGALPQGPGAFARDFPAAQDAAISSAPELAHYESELDHAHVDALELVYELGAPVAILLVWLGIAVARALRSDPTRPRRAAAWTLAIGAGLGVFGYPLFSPACATVLAWAAAIALAPTGARTHGGWGSSALAVACGLGLQVLAIHQARSELALTAALAAHDRGDDLQGLACARRAVAQFPGADATFVLGNFELVAGDPGRAAHWYRRSLELRPRARTRANLDLALRRVEE